MCYFKSYNPVYLHYLYLRNKVVQVVLMYVYIDSISFEVCKRGNLLKKLWCCIGGEYKFTR